MSTIKFVYRSQNIPDIRPIENSSHTITSGAVYEAISNIQMNTLFKSGYLPEGVASVVPQHDLSYANGTITLAAGSKLFIPAGFEEGEFKFTEFVTSADITENRTTSEGMDAYIFVDTANNDIICKTKRSNQISSSTGEPLDSVKQQVWATLTEPVVPYSVTSDGAIWWDLSQNKIKVYSYQSGSFQESEYAMPIGIVSSADNYITGLAQDFLMAGVCGNITWLNPGATLVVPTGLNTEDRTFTDEIIEVTDVIAKLILTDSSEEFTDYALYFTFEKTFNPNTGEYDTKGIIEGPVDEYVFDSDKGLFVDGEGSYHDSARYALISAKHLTTSVTDPLTDTAFAIRPTMALADNDDIEYVIRLIGSSMGLTIDDLEEEIKAATADRALLRQQVKEWLYSFKETLKDDLHHSITHKQMPVTKYFVDRSNTNVRKEYAINGLHEGYYMETEENPLQFVILTKCYPDPNIPYEERDPRYRDPWYEDEGGVEYDLVAEEQSPSVVTPDIAVDETIKGTKTFEQPIVGTLNGAAKYVYMTQDAGELIPVGISAYDSSGNNAVKASDSTVRFTATSVKATKFEGTCTNAYWADLAEMYETDAEYEVGTLLRWGGEKELTLANMGVANAVVSEKPAFLMNASAKGQPIALAGRVKVRVLGKVKKHDAIVLNEMAPGVGKVQENNSEVIVARALEDNDFVGEKLVMCAVRFSL